MLALLISLLGVLFSGPALAHRVNLFAWLEGDTVKVESSFGRDNPVQGGLINVFDSVSGELLLRGQTDEQGLFSFSALELARPGRSLRIVLDAGQGHGDEWTLEAEQFSALEAAPEPAASPAAPAAASPAAEPKAEPLSLSAVELEQIVAEALSRQLAPLSRDLAALREPGPQLRDIVGGLGWIMGLAGCYLYFRSRRR